MTVGHGSTRDCLVATSPQLADRWNNEKVRFREHTFLRNPNVPAAMKDNTVTVTVAPKGQPVGPSSRTSVQLPYGTPMSNVRELVAKVNPNVRVIQLANADLRRLCRWLGSRKRQQEFNRLISYILTESSRYCPTEVAHTRIGHIGCPAQRFAAAPAALVARAQWHTCNA